MAFKINFNPMAVRDWVRRRTLNTLREVADYTAARAVVHAPVRTGFLVSHIRMEELAGGLGFRVVSSAFYSVYVHDRIPFMAMAIADARQEWPSIARRQSVATGGTHNPEGFLSTTFTT